MTILRHGQFIANLTLLTTVVVFCLAPMAEYQLARMIEKNLPQLMMDVFDERLFNDGQGRVRNDDVIQLLAQHINNQLTHYIETGPLALVQDCQLNLTRIDDLAIPNNIQQTPIHRFITVAFLRNHINRTVESRLDCQYNPASWTLVVASLMTIFSLLWLTGIRPLNRFQSIWFQHLINAGYSGSRARRAILPLQGQQLDFNDNQRQCFEAIHQANHFNAAIALRQASLPAVRQLNSRDLHWLLTALRWNNADFEQALQLASTPDRLVIDLPEVKISIRGVDIPMAKTPLLYFAWYAMARTQGDGWITNPASNKPNKDLGTALASFMWRYKGHAKAIGDLEEMGLKAKTLDQNRSKIKDDICAALGETLANDYLFEVDKSGPAGRSRYRLLLTPEAISIIE